MSGPLIVDPEQLAVSGSYAEALCAEMSSALRSTEAAAEAALPGWLGRSRSALTARAQGWAEQTAALSARIQSHADGLRIGAVSFAEMDLRHTAVLAALQRRVPP